jgi:hypothetical protein
MLRLTAPPTVAEQYLQSRASAYRDRALVSSL